MSDFEGFYRDHVQLVHGLALARTGAMEQAEDLTQDTFLRAWQHFALLSAADPITRRAWLVRTLRNLMVDAWRRRGRETAESLERPDPGPEAAERAELRVDLQRALSELGERDQEMVVLRYLDDRNSREIAAIVGVPEGTVRRRLADCRKLLAQQLSAWAPRRTPG
jgi:RNA polymerase sigma-70 factor (ECF subfamily)